MNSNERLATICTFQINEQYKSDWFRHADFSSTSETERESDEFVNQFCRSIFISLSSKHLLYSSLYWRRSYLSTVKHLCIVYTHNRLFISLQFGWSVTRYCNRNPVESTLFVCFHLDFLSILTFQLKYDIADEKRCNNHKTPL